MKINVLVSIFICGGFLL